MILLLPVGLTAFAIVSVINVVESLLKKRDKKIMSSFETLSVDVKSLIAQSAAQSSSIATLNATVSDQTAEIAKLKAEAGTPDADVDALDALVKAALPVETPPPPVEAPPAV